MNPLQRKFSTQTTHSPKLTKQQHNAAVCLFEKEYGPFLMFPKCGMNRPYWRLVEMGLAEFDFGPRNSWLSTYCFMPLWTDPVC